jgi:PEP-CTERM motif
MAGSETTRRWKENRMRLWTRGALLTMALIGFVMLLDWSPAWAMGGGHGRRNHGGGGGGGGYYQGGGSSHNGGSHGGDVGSHGGDVATPEPLTMVAIGTGLAGTAAYRYIRRRKK